MICLLSASIPALLWFAGALFVLTEQGWEVVEVLRDPAQQSEISSFLGFLSSNGIWLWVSSAAISYFAALTIRKDEVFRHRELLVLTGMFSSLLAIDDFFLLHDRHFNQWLFYGMYVVLAGLLFLRHHPAIVEIDGFAFLVGLGFLGLSISSDAFQNSFTYSTVQIFEEGAKFIGAATWLYFVGRAASYQRQANDSDVPTPDVPVSSAV